MWFVYIDEEDTESWNHDTRCPDLNSMNIQEV